MDGGAVAGVALGLLCALLALALPLCLPLYAAVVGLRRREATQRHLAEAEPRLAHLVRTSTEAPDHGGPSALVHGAVAYAADFPSRWATGWVKLVGGQARSLTVQTDMARRLATVRMLEQAQHMGASGVANIRLESNQIDMGNSGQRGQGAMVIEMLAYGTALLPARGAGAP